MKVEINAKVPLVAGGVYRVFNEDDDAHYYLLVQFNNGFVLVDLRTGEPYEAYDTEAELQVALNKSYFLLTTARLVIEE